MFKRKVITFTVISMALAATPSLAGVDGEALKINALPKSGHVTLSGTIDGVDNNKEFTLRDSNGDTIDIDLSNSADLHEGDRVKVDGVVSYGFLGFGRGINATSVDIVDRADEMARAGNPDDAPYSLDNLQQGAKETYKEAKQSTKDAYAEVKQQAKAAFDSADGAIDDLPEEGSVSIKGNVAEVDIENKSFVLKDSTGDTIDVHSDSALKVSKGDTVVVQGQIKNEMAGFGEEIKAENIIIVISR